MPPVTTKATAPVDGAGSVLEYCTTGVGTPDTLLPGLDVIPQIGSDASYTDEGTDIDHTKRTYLKHTLPEDQDFELVLKSQPGNADQQAFVDMVIAKETISILVTRADGRTEQANFLAQNHYSAESGKDSKQMFACIGKLQDVVTSVVAGA